jgi:2-dehydropantoate 2-reductase
MCSEDVDAAGSAERTIVERYRQQMDKTTSMLQDVRKSRRTEIDFLNGYIVEKARRLGLSAPLNQRMVEVVHDIEGGRLHPEAAHLKELAMWRTGVE